MGLDMYFSARKTEFEHRFDELPNIKIEYDEDLVDLQAYVTQRKSLSVTTEYDIGYFRKFNALHNYIVREFTNGEDNCRPVYLSHEDCHKILDTLKSITPENAKDIMPTGSGFFFGSTEYDDYYFSDVADAIELFELICNLVDKDEKYKWSIIYQASW